MKKSPFPSQNSHDPSSWTPQAPQSVPTGDHDVFTKSDALLGKKIALIVTGGIAAYKTPMIARQLRSFGAQVTPIVTTEAKRYVGLEALAWACNQPVIEGLSFQAEHLSDTNPFDSYLVAPATYNVINGLRFGSANSPVLSILATALGRMENGKSSLLLAPTMNGQMHNSILQESLEKLKSLGVKLIPPRDDSGKHNLPDHEVFPFWVARSLTQSNLKGMRVLVTAGSIPTWIDDVRVMTNLFRGTLGIQIAKDLFMRGAQVHLVLGPASDPAPSFIPTTHVRSYDEYSKTCLNLVQQLKPDYQVLSAAVADYEIENKITGKAPSSGLHELKIKPTPKVVELLRQLPEAGKTISFKFQMQMSHQELMDIARSRLQLGHTAVIANRGEEIGPMGEQIAHLVTDQQVYSMVGKPAISRQILDFIEKDSQVHPELQI